MATSHRDNAAAANGKQINVRKQNRPMLPRELTRILTSLCLGAAVMAGAVLYKQTSGGGIDPATVSSIPRHEAEKPLASFIAAARPMPVCGVGKRVNCIVDGDTFWLGGEKYRIANIDTPELKGKCSAEQATAKRARQRLAEIINDRPVEVRVTGTDPYGRKLVIISDANGDIGDRLVGEGLAEVWGGDFIDWCRG